MVFVFHALGISYGFDQLKWDGWWRSFDAPTSFLVLSPITLGWIGVPIFFVVSGFCIHLSHQRSSDTRISLFYLKRFFRIYPPYLAALLVFSFLPPWSYIPLNSRESITQFLSHVFMVHNYGESTFYGINSTFWSVAVESHLYLIYPILLAIVHRSGWKTALAISVTTEIGLRGFAAFQFAATENHAPYWMIGAPVFYWFSWSVGAAAADAWLNRRPLPFQRIPLVVFPLLMVLTSFFKPLAMFSFVFASLGTVSLIQFLLDRTNHAGGTHEGFLLKHLRLAGTVSYSIYLLHFPILVLVPKFVGKLLPAEGRNPMLLMAACTACWIPVLAGSWLFYQTVEKPSITFGKRVLRQWFPKPVAAAAPVAGASGAD